MTARDGLCGERPIGNVDAVTEFYRGVPHAQWRTGPENNEVALQHFKNAIALDPTYSPAYGGAAACPLSLSKKTPFWKSAGHFRTTPIIGHRRWRPPLRKRAMNDSCTANNGFAWLYSPRKCEQCSTLRGLEADEAGHRWLGSSRRIRRARRCGESVRRSGTPE